MRSKLHNFKIKKVSSNCYCDIWRSSINEGGQYYSVEGGFLYYTKKQISQYFHEYWLRKLNGI